MLRPSYPICVLSGYTSTPIVCCLRLSEVAHNIFSHCPEKRWGIFQQIPPLKQVNLYVEADTRLCVHKAGGVSGKTLSIYLSGSWQRTELTSMGFPQQSRGALFTVLTCPVYAQRLMLFANHTLWKFTNGVRHATLWVCQLPSQQLAISLTVCVSVRKQLSLSICLAVTFSNTCVPCVFMLGVSPPSEGCHLPFGLTKRPRWNMKKKREGGKRKRDSWNYIIFCWSSFSTNLCADFLTFKGWLRKKSCLNFFFLL